MKIIVDADACPVKQQIIQVAHRYTLDVIFVFSISHSGNLKLQDNRRNVEIVMVDNVSQAADMAIMNRVKAEDIVITVDFGLASLVLAKKAAALSHSGSAFNEDNIDRLLFERHLSSVVRKSGGRMRGPSKRSREDDIRFAKLLESVILKKMKDI
jgi:uncharacterized protein YaiI (UPF0178 family)